MNIINKVGLEAEFFLKDKNNALVFPARFDFDYDDYIILGEFRSDPGETREETIGNFIKSLCKVRRKAKENKLSLSFGYEEITPQFKARILKEMGTKEIQNTHNIHKIDLLEYSDDVVEFGKIIKSRISAGLHVHFSREVLFSRKIDDKEVTDKLFLLTETQKRRIIQKMDSIILPKHKLNTVLKYRQPGFYENKSWGFEYRSLPMYDGFVSLENLEGLVDFSFNCLESLSK